MLVFFLPTSPLTFLLTSFSNKKQVLQINLGWGNFEDRGGRKADLGEEDKVAHKEEDNSARSRMSTNATLRMTSRKRSRGAGTGTRW